MSRKYKFSEKDKLYFVSFSTVYWLDVFTRDEYKTIWIDSIKYCQQNKGLEVYGWCLMTNHAHMIIGSETSLLENIMRDIKKYTSERIRKAIQDNLQESRREWMVWLMKRAASKNSNNNTYQFWQQSNHPIPLLTFDMFKQKLDYIHNNPVKAGFVDMPEYWKYSSAIDYCGGKGLIDIIYGL